MKLKKLLCLVMALLMLLGLALPAAAANGQVTVLFTHDLHSQLLPAIDETGSSYGGYARLMTAIKQQKKLHPNALLVDSGDFSMGSLFQTVYATDAAELRIMGAMGYDATTFGNHEFDYRTQGLADMLNAAVESGEPVPPIVVTNYKPPKLGEEGYGPNAELAWTAYQNYGVQDYIVVERGGVNFAIFGIMGYDSHECSPTSGMAFQDPILTAQATVDRIKAEVPQPRVVVCLSHGGTNINAKKSEDEILAKQVEGIDLMVSSHTHTVLEKPIQVNDTYIVSCGEYSKNLGVITLDRTAEGLKLADYQLIPINDSVEEDPAIAAKIEEYKGLVEKNYLSRFGTGLGYDTVLAQNPVAFESQNQMSSTHHESPLGNLIADSYVEAVKRAEGENYIPVDFAMTAAGVVRESLPQGDLTVSNIFNVSSLGIGPDGVPGYPLVSVYITGKDLMKPDTWQYINFQPHLLPQVRGIEVTIYATLKAPITNDELYKLYSDFYKDEYFVHVFPASKPVQTKWVAGTNFCDMTPTYDARTHRLIVSSVIDNIGKGAAGQAIQNMNLICGLPETTGLMVAPQYP